MPENKTKPTGASVEDYIAELGSEQQRADCQELITLPSRRAGDATDSTAARYLTASDP